MTVELSEPVAPIIKAADMASLTSGSLSTISGYGSMGSKAQPFNYNASMASFHSWCFAAAMINAKAVAAVPLRLYVRSKPRPGMKRVSGWATRAPSRRVKSYMAGRAGHRPSSSVVAKIAEWGDDGFEEVAEPHPVLRLLSTYNPDVNGYEAGILQLVYMQLCGTSYVMPILDAAGVPIELWPLPSQHVKWIPAKPGSDRMVDGFTYGTSNDNVIKFEPEEVIPYRLTLDPRRPWFEGMGFVEAAWSALCLSKSKSEHDRAFYDNYARPDWLLTVSGDYGNEALDRFEANIERKLQGSRRHGSFLTIPGEVSATALNIPPSEIGDPVRVIEVIAATFGVSVSRLMANQNVAGGQAEVGDKSHLRDTVLPICRAIEEKHNERLLTYWGMEDDAFLAYDDPVPENEAADIAASIQRSNAGHISINEARAEDGMEPIRGGDVPRFNGVPLDQMAAPMLPGLPMLPNLTPTANRPTTAQDAPAAEGTQSPPPTAATPPRQPAPDQTQPNADATKPDVGTVAEATLNGAQITAALDVIGRLRLDEIVIAVAIELLVAVGIPRERATAMADQTAAAAKRNPPPASEQPNANGSGTGSDGANTGAKSHGRVSGDSAAPDDGSSADGKPVAARPADADGAMGRGVGVGSADEPARLKATDPDARSGSAGVAGPAAAGDAASADAGRDPVQARSVRLRGVIGQLDAHDHSHICGKATDAPADDHIRDGQPEKPEDKFAAGLSAIFARQSDTVLNSLPMILAGFDVAKKAEPKVTLTEADIRKLEKRIASQLAGYTSDIVDIATPVTRANLAAGHLKGQQDPAVARAMESAGKPVVAFDVNNPDVQLFLEGYEIKLAGRVNATTTTNIAYALADGIESGESVSQLAARVQDNFAGASDNRSTVIARTESARAYVEGQKQGWSDSGVVQGMTWMLAAGGCPICTALAAEFNNKVIPLDGTFMKLGSSIKLADGGTFTADYQDITGAPAHPNCRCDIQAVTE